MTEMKINQQELMAACQEVIQYSRKMAADGLVVGTSGNVSRRIGDLIAITPSGVDYDILKPEDICLLELDGTPVRCDRAPSSELPLHLQVYRARQDANAVVHTHSPYASALSTLTDEVPNIHYILMMMGGHVPVAPYATFGTEQLAENIREKLSDKADSILLQNHGLVTTGKNLSAAYEKAVQLEFSCKIYLIASSCGKLRILSEEEMQDCAERRKELFAYRAAFKPVDKLKEYVGD